MRNYLTWTMLLLAALLVTSGCQSTGKINVDSEGAGFVMTHPRPETVDYMSANDKRFRNETLGNNMMCQKMKACRK